MDGECTEVTGDLALMVSTGVGTDTDTDSLDTGPGEIHGDKGVRQDPQQCTGKDSGEGSPGDCKDSVLCAENGWDHVWTHRMAPTETVLSV